MYLRALSLGTKHHVAPSLLLICKSLGASFLSSSNGALTEHERVFHTVPATAIANSVWKAELMAVIQRVMVVLKYLPLPHPNSLLLLLLSEVAPPSPS